MDPDELSALLDEEEPEHPAGPQPLHGWAVVATTAGLISCASLLGAGAALEEAELGRASAARGCDPRIGAGLVLLVFAGALLGVVRFAVDRRFAQEIVFDQVRFWALLPVPAFTLLFSAPAFLGCRVATDIANLEGLGSALSGTPGIALVGASAFTLGLVPLMSVRTFTPPAAIVAHYEQLRADPTRPDPVEDALAKLDAPQITGPAPGFGEAPPRLDSPVAQDMGVDPSGQIPGAHPAAARPNHAPDRGAPPPDSAEETDQ